MGVVSKRPEFDLLEEPWIPVVRDNRPELVSLRRCLIDAHEIEGLTVDAPLETVAVLRQVLLPVYLDAMFGGDDGLAPPVDEQAWRRLWDVGSVDASRIGAYLDRHAQAFQLFGARPFAQVAGLATATGDTKPVSLLLAAAASGNNVPLFSSRTEADPPALTPAAAARALLATHCFDTAGIKSGAVGDRLVKAGKTTGNVTGPLGALGVVVPFGRTVFETLMLHTPFQPQRWRPADRPQWRGLPDDEDFAGGPGWASRPARGLLDLLTWQARRIRLIPEFEGDAVVVRRVVVAAGDRLTEIPQQVEPHTAWKPSTTSAGQVPVRHVAGRAAWRGLQALLAVGDDVAGRVTSPLVLRRIADLRAERCLPDDLPVQVLTVGVQYGTQSAVVEEVIVDQIPLPLAALETDGEVAVLLEQVVSHADDLRVAANRFGDELREAAGGDKLAWNRGQRLGDTLMHDFTPVVRRMLAGLQRQPELVDQAEQAWRSTARRLALRVIDAAVQAASPGAFLGRESRDGHPRRASLAEARYRAAIRTIIGDTTPVPSLTGGA